MANEYSQAFSLAKNALVHVAKFQTPPTPEVYEVWYRYVEGKNEALCDSLNYCVNDAKAVSKSQMLQVRQAYLSSDASAEETARISSQLADELGGLQSIVEDQIVASDQFDSSLGSAAENLTGESTPSEAKACIELAKTCTEEMQGHLKAVSSQLETSQEHIDEMRASLVESQKLLMVDPVTGVGNRRFFDTTMDKHFEGKLDSNRHYFLLVLDLDKFKSVNDTYGHSTGDRVLKYVATKIQAMSPDLAVARFGGDEFAIFMDSPDPTAGKHIGELVCDHFAKTKLKDDQADATLERITTSIGVARLRDDDDRQTWFDRADKLLYFAKTSGRNQVMVERNLNDSPNAVAN